MALAMLVLTLLSLRLSCYWRGRVRFPSGRGTAAFSWGPSGSCQGGIDAHRPAAGQRRWLGC